MTDEKYCSFDQFTHVQILLVCLTANDTLRTVLNNLFSTECNKLVHNNVLWIHAINEILF